MLRAGGFQPILHERPDRGDRTQGAYMLGDGARIGLPGRELGLKLTERFAALGMIAQRSAEVVVWKRSRLWSHQLGLLAGEFGRLELRESLGRARRRTALARHNGCAHRVERLAMQSRDVSRRERNAARDLRLGQPEAVDADEDPPFDRGQRR